MDFGFWVADAISPWTAHGIPNPQASAEEGGGVDAEAGLRGSSTAKLMYELLRRQRENSHGLRNDSPYERALAPMYEAASQGKRRAIANVAQAQEPATANVGAPGGAGRWNGGDATARPPLIKWPGWDCETPGCVAVGRERNFESNKVCYRCKAPRPGQGSSAMACAGCTAEAQALEMGLEAPGQDEEAGSVAAFEAALQAVVEAERAEQAGGSVGLIATCGLAAHQSMVMPTPFIVDQRRRRTILPVPKCYH